ncbi:hypothetical protein WJX81_006360 [Elliptochloris bilobata]|uniref:SOUL heme-binding protein n=1 Tax=Elliptochloris bilobata TaxID=381761 RepID=A0AAW1RKC3_9CHLO
MFSADYGTSSNYSSSGENVLEDACSFLSAELRQLFTTGEVTRARYLLNFTFQDPIVKVSSLEAFVNNLRLLRTVFNIDFVLHSCRVSGPTEVVTRWTMRLQQKLLPWRPALVFTGRSCYTVESASGRLATQTDVWDAIKDNSYLSVEGVAHVLRQATNPQTTPGLDQPAYEVLRRAGDYEVRRYEPYVVAEVSMPASAAPASGTGFNELAGYIFGGNAGRQKMEMTTPVITTAGQPGAAMRFPMERKLGTNAALLPTPNDLRVITRMEEGGVFASASFSGFPLDFEVVEAERRLRGALLLDGLQPLEGYALARYNDPFTLPLFRRNEVLIALKDFELE